MEEVKDNDTEPIAAVENAATGAEDPASWIRAKEAAETLTQQAAIEDIECQYVNLMQDRNNLQTQLDEAKNQIKTVSESAASKQLIETQLAGSKHQLEMAEKRAQSLEEEKKAAEERLDRVEAEGDKLREEIR